MHDVFLSYSREDKSQMLSIAHALESSGIRCWTDRELQPGIESWPKAVGKAIEEAKYVVVLLSPEAKKSDWVETELMYARESCNKPVIPLLVRGSKSDSVPFILSRTQHIDAVSNLEAGIQALIVTLQKRLNPVSIDVTADSEVEGTSQEPQAGHVLEPISNEALPRSVAFFGGRTGWKISNLGEVSTLSGPHHAGKLQPSGPYPHWTVHGIEGYCDEFEFEGESILILGRGSELLQAEVPAIRLISGKFTTNSDHRVLQSNATDIVSTTYLFYFLRAVDVRRSVKGFASPAVDWSEVLETLVAIPPKAEQDRLLSIIDEQQRLISENRAALTTELSTLAILEKALLFNMLKGDASAE